MQKKAAVETELSAEYDGYSTRIKTYSRLYYCICILLPYLSHIWGDFTEVLLKLK